MGGDFGIERGYARRGGEIDVAGGAQFNGSSEAGQQPGERPNMLHGHDVAGGLPVHPAHIEAAGGVAERSGERELRGAGGHRAPLEGDGIGRIGDAA